VKTPPSQDDFAKLLMDRIRQAGEKGKIICETEGFCLRGEGKAYAAMFLTNAYKEYCAADSNGRERVIETWVRNWFFLTNAYKEYCAADSNGRERVIQTWVRNWFAASKDMPEDFEDAKPDLLPIVRSRSHFELNCLELPLDWPHQVLGEHFGVGIAYDLPESMLLIQRTDLDAWGVSFYKALEAAMESLLSLKAEFICPESGEGAYLSATGDNYDASRLLIKDAIRAFRVKGDPIAMIPNRENLIVVGSEDVEGLAGMVKLATEVVKEPHPISGIALWLEGDEWTPWLPPPSHPSYKEFQELRLQTFGQDYAQQKEMLDKLHEKNGEDVFVASFSVIQSPEGRVVSYATWVADADSLLPKTDVLVLGRLGTMPVMVEWQRAVDIVGDLMEPVDIYPPRYRVRGFPSEKQLAAMGNMLP